ncbi:15403_t:CDS:2 [Gigaspora margarita]|uniref:15403_t:CDS:1 n=1 Tax=Gigaspora margarita TaxID=4874 RepID=A0ABN7VN45_GIGMA|nr:15403_t:CDS:2 [Gigaspora margarita]
MAPQIKRQKQIDNLLREKGHYLNQKNQKFTKPQNTTNIESQEKWIEDELVEFKEIGTRLMNEILRWHKDAAKSLRPNKEGYMAKCVQIWGNHFIKTRELLPYRQNKHTKLESLIDNENFRFRYDERRKGIYFDGYKRPDVMAYRNEWVKRMFLYKQNMKDFVSKSLEFILKPQLNLGKKEYAQITHDEYYFYANDGQQRIWIHDGETILYPKHLGHSIMVSAFLYPCHELLRLSDQQLYENPHIEDKEIFVIHLV